ncbi:MAG: nuclear transport factor 2 family protein [Gemmatimonadetes bacterium]|nr:nuclear transport factor 2 family protein [Gemmatimonadota bacterium]
MPWRSSLALFIVIFGVIVAAFFVEPIPASSLAIARPGLGVRAAALLDTLQRLEEGSWRAWAVRDGDTFAHLLSEDHVDVGPGGPSDKARVVAGVRSPACVVADYAIGGFRLARFSDDAALLTYHASQKTACGGVAVPSPTWVSSLYVRRGGRWQNALFQQTQALR